MINCLQKNSNNIIILYTCSIKSKLDIINLVKNIFDIKINQNQLYLIKLYKCKYGTSEYYNRFTLLLQTLGSILPIIESLQLEPDIIIETQGFCALGLIYKLIYNTKIVTYIHYPIISKEMINKNQNKYIYYKLFSILYYLFGYFYNLVLVNSTWTKNNIDYLWNLNSKILYPSTNLKTNKNQNRNRNILYLAQFRREKNHSLVLKAFSKIYKKYNNKLLLIGGCRNEKDEIYIQELKDKANKLNILENIEFYINLDNENLKSILSSCLIGVHCMVDEHFGIVLLEYLLNGLIIVANNSGGPKLDIINNNEDGFLACNELEYAHYFDLILNMNEIELQNIRSNAYQNVQKFSHQNFEVNFLNFINNLY